MLYRKCRSLKVNRQRNALPCCAFARFREPDRSSDMKRMPSGGISGEAWFMRFGASCFNCKVVNHDCRFFCRLSGKSFLSLI
jgi:hypothetical protein